jgi:6-phosphogluconolactonase
MEIFFYCFIRELFRRGNCLGFGNPKNLTNHKTKISMTPKLFPKLTILALTLLPMVVFADNDVANPGAVYTMDNSVAGNNVLAFHRSADGSLTLAGAFPTGGTGTGTGLGNQSALILSRDARWLFACNAGSDEISAFAVTPGGLALSDKVKSEGRRPVSLTLRNGLLYVLNAGGAVGERDNITAFRFESGNLFHIPGSTRTLSADNTGPAQVSFTSDGDVLVVTEKTTSIIDTFTVGDDGLVNGQRTFSSPIPTPFGFAAGRNGRIFVSEANGSGPPNGSSVSSYEVSDDGELVAISSAVPTKQTAACWIVLTGNERFAYDSNTGSGTISGYRVAPDGTLQLLNSDGVTGITGPGPIDLAMSRDSLYLYSLNSGNGSISAFRVNANGSLDPLPDTSGIPAGSNGLAAQ